MESLVLLALATSISPGPNNTMLSLSGFNYGFARTIPHMMGICVGFPSMIMLVGLGFGSFIGDNEGVLFALKWIGAVYMVYLAIKMLKPCKLEGDSWHGEPLSFLNAASFQWVNGKAWVMATTALMTFSSEGMGIGQTVEIALVFGLVGIPTVIIWTLFGQQMTRFLKTKRSAFAFNAVMASALLVSVVFALIN